MKKLFYLMVLALMPMFLTACSDDDDEPTGVENAESLYGTWQQTNGYAFEDGAKHHEKSVSADEAEYLKFDTDGTCSVHGGERGHFDDVRSSYSFVFNQEEKVLKIGQTTFVVDALSGGILKLKDEYKKDEYVMVTYKKVSNSVWDNL